MLLPVWGWVSGTKFSSASEKASNGLSLTNKAVCNKDNTVYFWVKQKTMKIYLYHTSGFFSSLFSQNHVHSIFQWYALQMTANETIWYFIFSRTQLFTLCLILNPLLLIIAALTALLRTQQQRFLHHFILTVWKLCLYIRLWALTKQTKKRTNQYPDGNSMVRWPEEV